MAPLAMHEIKRLGDLNGIWQMLFKATQLIIPIMAITIIPWGVWVTNKAYENDIRHTKVAEWIALGPRFTVRDAESLELRILAKVRAERDSAVDRLSVKLDELSNQIRELQLQIARGQMAKPNP